MLFVVICGEVSSQLAHCDTISTQHMATA